jgi:hypothetical protein
MEIVFAFCFFIVFFLAMSIGLIVKGKPIKGSCGGVAALMGNESCEICGGDPNKCDATQSSQLSNDLSYNAMKNRDKH